MAAQMPSVEHKLSLRKRSPGLALGTTRRRLSLCEHGSRTDGRTRAATLAHPHLGNRGLPRERERREGERGDRCGTTSRQSRVSAHASSHRPPGTHRHTKAAIPSPSDITGLEGGWAHVCARGGTQKRMGAAPSHRLLWAWSRVCVRVRVCGAREKESWCGRRRELSRGAHTTPHTRPHPQEMS
eukprot:5665378-Prymnesium_polylepis.1